MAAQPHSVLADSAGLLSEQLYAEIHGLSAFLEPVSARVDREFRRRLRALGLSRACVRALSAITPGALCRLLSDGAMVGRAFEEVEYQGRRIAKLGLRPQEIVRALREYDGALAPALVSLGPEERANFQWARDQLHFCTVLILNQAFYQVREAESRTFYELARWEVSAERLDDLFQGFLEVLARYTSADAAHLYLRRPVKSGWQRLAAAPDSRPPESPAPLERPARCTDRAVALDPAWANRYASVWSVPMIAGGRVAGLLQFGFSRTYRWLPREKELLEAAAERCLAASERVQLMGDLATERDRIRELAERMLHVEEAERGRISRELHDEAGQCLLSIRLQLEMLEQSSRGAALKARLRDIRLLSEKTIVEIRGIIAALSPSVLRQFGFPAAVRRLAGRLRQSSGIRVRVRMAALAELARDTAHVGYRILQECCNNIAKHSGARHVMISAQTADGWLRLLVQDDGSGFDVDAALSKDGAFGIAGIRERVAVLGGTCSITSVRAGAQDGRRSGTVLRIHLPLASG